MFGTERPGRPGCRTSSMEVNIAGAVNTERAVRVNYSNAAIYPASSLRTRPYTRAAAGIDGLGIDFGVAADLAVTVRLAIGNGPTSRISLT